MKQSKGPHCYKIPSCLSKNKALSCRGQQDKRKDFFFYNHLAGWLQSSFLGATGRRLIGRDYTVVALWGQIKDYLKRFPHENPSCISYHVVISCYHCIESRGWELTVFFRLWVSKRFHARISGEGDVASPQKNRRLVRIKTEGWGPHQSL